MSDVNLRAPRTIQDDKAEIDFVIRRFFEVFTNRHGKQPQLEILYDLCLGQCLIVKTCGAAPEIFSLAGFIEPRRRLLNNGLLVGFAEWEVHERTEIFGDVAQRLSTYEKSGELDGKRFAARGMKSFQLIHTSDGWRISAVAWDDERPGFAIPEAFAGATSPSSI